MTHENHVFLSLGPWRAIRSSGELVGRDGSERLEPRIMELLWLLASQPGDVVSRDEILRQVWPGVIVGEDTVARAVCLLRKALGDDARTPRYIETLHRRGYRYIGPVGEGTRATPARPPAVKVVAPGRAMLPTRTMTVVVSAFLAALPVIFGGLALTPSDSAHASSRISAERAGDYYFQYSRPDNEAAIELYERIISTDPGYAPAYAGLANALVQRVIRWPGGVDGGPTFTNLADALRSGHTRSTNGRWTLERAAELAKSAVALAPADPAPHKALGLVYSAQENFAGALSSYGRAVALDEHAWGPMINIGDILEISGHDEEALRWIEAAYEAMTRRYDEETARIRPWYAETAVLIGDRHRGRGALDEAEGWYRRVLEYAPFHDAATTRLAELLEQSGDTAGAEALCGEFRSRIESTGECGGEAL